jgi:DNA polymerase
MRVVSLTHEEDFDGWRAAARALALARVPPDQVSWQVGAAADLFAEEALMESEEEASFSVPRPFIELARAAVCHSDPERFSLLYALLLRLRSNPKAMEDQADPLVRRLELMAKEVRRDLHKMRAFLRFREVEAGDRESSDLGPGSGSGARNETRFVAWFEPDHHIVRTNSGFFIRRFSNMDWSILTPELSAHWDGGELTFSPGASKADAPTGDPIEETWKTYYASIFNPARVKVKAMTKEMPRKYWKNMPETALVGELIAGARGRETEMVERSRRKLSEIEKAGIAIAEKAERRLQPGGNALAAWEALLEEAKRCTRCHLYKCGTQTVFGEGPLDAPLMFVGEQPGDQEDIAGRPFVGPAGQLFDRALKDAGVDRSKTYVTNAVKHFKFEQRGKRRIHSKPQGPEIEACRWWLEQERMLIRPPITVALGATAARSIFEKVVTISALRGRPHPLAEGGEAWVTVHPSFLLRVRDNREAEYERFVEDLRVIGRRAKEFA